MNEANVATHEYRSNDDNRITIRVPPPAALTAAELARRICVLKARRESIEAQEARLCLELARVVLAEVAS